MEMGEDEISVLDYKGLKDLRQTYLRNRVVSVFLLPQSYEMLNYRLENRGHTDEVVDAKRKAWKKELDKAFVCNYRVMNYDLDESTFLIENIVSSEKLARKNYDKMFDVFRKEIKDIINR